MYYSNGDVYIGQWRNDWKHGKGIMQYKNGDKYDGEVIINYNILVEI